MKTVVITGSAKGFGFELAKCFLQNNFNVVICDIDEESLIKAQIELEAISKKSQILTFKIDVTNEDDVNYLITNTLKRLNQIDIWINNAGVNQPNKALWELDKHSIDRLIDIDLKGTIICSKLIMQVMEKQKFGQIYNVEGHGSNDALIYGLSLYGTAKRAVTYFTEALAMEVKTRNLNILIGKITPGIMITNFINNALGNEEKIELDEKTKHIYNILGDYPDVIAKFMVQKIINNKKNNVKFTWLTNRRAMIRFMTANFKKRDFFATNLNK